MKPLEMSVLKGTSVQKEVQQPRHALQEPSTTDMPATTSAAVFPVLLVSTVPVLGYPPLLATVMKAGFAQKV